MPATTIAEPKKAQKFLPNHQVLDNNQFLYTITNIGDFGLTPHYGFLLTHPKQGQDAESGWIPCTLLDYMGHRAKNVMLKNIRWASSAPETCPSEAYIPAPASYELEGLSMRNHLKLFLEIRYDCVVRSFEIAWTDSN